MAYEQLLNIVFRPDHEIPFSREEIIKMILDDKQLKGEDVNSFRIFCKILNSIYHFEFHDQLEDLKSSYRYFNPDIENKNNNEFNYQDMYLDCLNNITKLLTDANYNEVSENDIQRSLVEESVVPVSSEVNFAQLETYKIFYQGQSSGTTMINSPIPFLKKEITFEYFNRVILLFKVKMTSELNAKEKISKSLTPGKVYLKYFRNIPKLDLEMIFPDPKPKMKLLTKVGVWLPLIGGVGVLLKKVVYDPYIIKVIKSPFEEGINITSLAIIFALCGYAFRTYFKYKNTIVSLLSEISQSLYFKDIGNNEAVLTSLVDTAEEEEGKEAILAYYFLLISPKTLNSAELDDMIETWMEERHNTKIDFEVSDGLRKLEDLQILTNVEGDKYSVLGLDDTLKVLDTIWDDYFQYN